jgi:integrase
VDRLIDAVRRRCDAVIRRELEDLPLDPVVIELLHVASTMVKQTITAANEPYRTLFTLAALTGARVSELLGLTWADVRLADLDDAEIEFAWQVDRQGQRRPTKTDGSARTVPIPRELARILASHKLVSRFSQSSDYVFATRTGGPLRQRNICRALRDAQGGRRREPSAHVSDAPRGRPEGPIRGHIRRHASIDAQLPSHPRQ